MEYNRQASSASLTTKLSNGYNVYDGVFSGPQAKLGSRVENYGDIFGGSGAVSSIPILDVPELNEGKVSVAVRSSRLDYSTIFGGFGDSDSAVSYEEFAKPNKVRKSSPEARTLGKAGSYAEQSDPSTFSEDKNVSSREASFQSFDGVKQFNVSYQKTNQGIGQGTNGTTHIAHLHAVPGFACLINEIPSQMSEGGKSTPAVIDGAGSNVKCHEGKMEGSPCRNATSGPGFCDTAKKTSKSGNCKRSNSNERLFDAFKIDFSHLLSRAPPPSEASPRVGNDKFHFQRSAASKIEDSRRDAPEGASGNCSPPYFDEEVDANSVAAASAAAVRKAIEEAQARIKIAKELMERKKEALQNRVKLSFDDLKAKKCDSKVKNSKDKRAQDVRGRVDKPLHHFVGMQMRNVKANQVSPGFIGSEKPTVATGAVGIMEREEFRLAQADHRQEATDVKAAKQFCELANTDVYGGTLLKHELANNGKENIQSQNEFELRVKKTLMEIPEISEDCDKIPISVDVHELDRFEGRFNSELEECANKLNSTQKVHDQEENKEKLGNAQELQESEQKVKASNGNQMCKNILKDLQNLAEDEKKLRDPHEGVNSRLRKPELKEKERKQKVISCLNETEKSHEKPCERKEDAETHVAAWKLEENKEGNGANWYNEKKSDQVYEQKVNEVRNNVYNNGEESAKPMEEVYEIKDNSAPKETRENEEKLEDAIQVNENEERWDQTNEWVQTERTESENDQRTAGEIENDTQGNLIDQENNVVESDDLCEQDDNEELTKARESHWHEKYIQAIGETAEARAYEEIERMLEVTKTPFHPKKNKEESKATIDAYNKENFETSGQVQCTLEPNEAAKHLKDADKALEQYVNKTERVLGPGEQTEASASRSGGSDSDVEESKPAINEENKDNNFESSNGGRQVDNGTKVDTPQLLSTSEGKERADEETAEEIKTTQITQSKEKNHQKTPTMDEREAENTSRKKVELEMKRRKRMEEGKEREREKERVAVERAIREARERAFAEARERAERAAVERATAEARRRAVADAREKSERASVDANEKSSAEKAAMEAKLKAERSAVERATAEARERALEKALSEKTFKARNRGEKVAAEKVPGGSKENGMRQSYPFYDSQNKGSDSSSSSRFPSSANHSVPYSTEKFDGTNGESTQRCKARLERHQRTAERAAKALAEKNMRDRLAQKEQAERNRLAEALDAEVKRWSSGKEGNLRALISTLQYILGPDSGWQPIPLTYIISTTAVKKAYRKATLFVHPDKLQQRGASIQQKYTCEKVFDILKEAYNKISAEDR
ncbi:auxilin-like protein 1 [Tripterygium wilfordii]|uniref:Auxilin-like protein 1 n=1 Tax=Tripterygium wilfordii TaxID=458696 RepID=A0A7J7DL90_TRIWF|nr:auxilin-like protein 1 [Tripterygium wilfordii]XP_038704356.1 auxilin-like protein 1 [Tripterygium wilfordii]KAF5747130.1 auxilin-like protein 1 [Tripterygium wilfordii]